MNILLRPNFNKPDAISCSREIIRRLLALGMSPMLEQSAKSNLDEDGCVYGGLDELLLRCDLVMPVGGDGTMMRAARVAVGADLPVLGVNAGRVGFLTQLEACELDALSILKERKYKVTERMMLTGEVNGSRDSSFIALNDIVVSHAEAMNIADIEVSEGDRAIMRQRADGVIFSTPTGSTAYSLAAGGPVADPELELIVLTAICPHATFRYSLVLPVNRSYTVREMVINRDNGLIINADGKEAAVIGAGDELVISKYSKRVKFIDLGLHDFYSSLNEKLSWR